VMSKNAKERPPVSRLMTPASENGLSQHF
jgi:hypothetical protein